MKKREELSPPSIRFLMALARIGVDKPVWNASLKVGDKVSESERWARRRCRTLGYAKSDGNCWRLTNEGYRWLYDECYI